MYYLGIVLVKARYKLKIHSSSSLSFPDTLPTSIIPKYITNATTRSTCKKENTTSKNNSSPPPITLSTKNYCKVRVNWSDNYKSQSESNHHKRIKTGALMNNTHIFDPSDTPEMISTQQIIPPTTLIQKYPQFSHQITTATPS